MGDACACDGQAAGLRLLRGQNELADCEAGFHCDCATKTVLQCDDGVPFPMFGQRQLDESSQMCNFGVDCAAQLKPKPATTEEPATTTPAETSCACSVRDGPPRQLIRGQGEQDKCEAGEYCDCATRAVMHCEGLMERFDETSQGCELLLDCEEALAPSTPTAAPSDAPNDVPSDASSVTATAATAEASTVTLAPQCTCDPSGPAQQLLRGAGQLQSCEAGTYCDCGSRQLGSCAVSSLFAGIVFNEEDQSCVYDSDFCRAFFDPKPKTQPTAAAPTTSSEGTTTPSRSGRCVCQRGGHELQLMRGPSATADCVQGYYCDCLAQSVRRCESLLNADWKFDEDEQECKYDFDCQSFLDKHPAVPDDNNGAGDSSSSAGALVDWAGSTHAVWYRFVIVAFMVIVANVGVIYSIQYYCRLRGYPAPPSRLIRCRRTQAAQGADALPEKSLGGESRA